MIYAPIVIPTLNRIEHLQRCINSLQKNSWAKYTPLIISVDYPPSEKYKAGYQKVCDYLKCGLINFHSVEIIFQEENLGAYENAEFLRKYVGKNYDRYIFLEDDIEASPNFIEYIDKGLEIFEEDDDIIAICAGSPSKQESEVENIVLTHDFAAYGYGTWLKKENQYYEKINRKYLIDIVGNMHFMLMLAMYDPSLVFSLQEAILRRSKLYQLPNGEVPVIDMMIKIYAVLEGKYVVTACNKKVRNWGLDGSGENCPIVKDLAMKNGGNDEREHFDYRYPMPLSIYKRKIKISMQVILRVFVAFVKLKIWKSKSIKRK